MRRFKARRSTFRRCSRRRQRGIVLHGLASTLGVTLEMMIMHGQACAPGAGANGRRPAVRFLLKKPGAGFPQCLIKPFQRARASIIALALQHNLCESVNRLAGTIVSGEMNLVSKGSADMPGTAAAFTAFLT